MNYMTRAMISSLLKELFDWIQSRVIQVTPTVKYGIGFSENESFSLRAYARYSEGNTTIVISFDIKSLENGCRISGDIETEEGTNLKDILEETLCLSEKIDAKIICSALRFAIGCTENLDVIIRSLMETKP